MAQPGRQGVPQHDARGGIRSRIAQLDREDGSIAFGGPAVAHHLEDGQLRELDVEGHTGHIIRWRRVALVAGRDGDAVQSRRPAAARVHEGGDDQRVARSHRLRAEGPEAAAGVVAARRDRSSLMGEFGRRGMRGFNTGGAVGPGIAQHRREGEQLALVGIGIVDGEGKSEVGRAGTGDMQVGMVIHISIFPGIVLGLVVVRARLEEQAEVRLCALLPGEDERRDVDEDGPSGKRSEGGLDRRIVGSRETAPAQGHLVPVARHAVDQHRIARDVSLLHPEFQHGSHDRALHRQAGEVESEERVAILVGLVLDLGDVGIAFVVAWVLLVDVGIGDSHQDTLDQIAHRERDAANVVVGHRIHGRRCRAARRLQEHAAQRAGIHAGREQKARGFAHVERPHLPESAAR